MTCIVGLVNGKDVWLGGDRAATDGNLDQYKIAEPKIFVIDGVGFGVCGLPKVMDAVKHSLVLETRDASSDPKGFLVNVVVPAIRQVLIAHNATVVEGGQHYFHGAFLIAYAGRLFELQGNFQLFEPSAKFHAVGSGAQPALGALRASKGSPKKRLLNALKISAENNAGVAPPFDLIKV